MNIISLTWCADPGVHLPYLPYRLIGKIQNGIEKYGLNWKLLDK